MFLNLLTASVIAISVGNRSTLDAPKNPWVPVVFSLSAFAIVANQIRLEPGESLAGLSMVLIGWPVYHFWAKRSYQRGREPQ